MGFRVARDAGGVCHVGAFVGGSWRRLWIMTPDPLNAGGWLIKEDPLAPAAAAAIAPYYRRLEHWARVSADTLSAQAAPGMPTGDDGAPNAGAGALP